jgi:hypothetical protein
MHWTPASGAFGFLTPPLQPRMPDVVIKAGAQAIRQLALDAKQGVEHQSLGCRRVE